MTTKIPAELSSTPGIVDGSNATAITIDNSEIVSFSSHIKLIDNGYVVLGAGEDLKLNSDGTNGIINAAQGYLALQTSSSERLRVTDNGLTFNGDTAAANALDDYEEGSWTPTIIGSSGASGQSYSIQYGTYTRIGNFVHLNFDVRLSALGTLSGTYVHIGGHGFTFKANNLGGSALVGYAANVSNSNHYPLTAYIHSTGVYLMQGGNGYITTAAAGGNFITNTTVLIGTITGILA